MHYNLTVYCKVETENWADHVKTNRIKSLRFKKITNDLQNVLDDDSLYQTFPVESPERSIASESES